MNKHPFSGRAAKFEIIEGVFCALVPLGKEGKQGPAIIELEDWFRFLDNGYSPNLRLNSSGNVVTSHRQSAKGRSTDTTVARIILSGIKAKKAHRVKYVNGNRLDLRQANLELVKGKSGGPLRPNMPDPRKIGRRASPDFVATKEVADQRKELMASKNVQPHESVPVRDYTTMTLSQILLEEDF